MSENSADRYFSEESGSGLKTLKYCVNGEWKESKTEKYMDCYNPSTGDVIAKAPCCTKEEVESAIQRALATDGPVVMDFIVEPEENVFPMVPAGEAINRMIGGMA